MPAGLASAWQAALDTLLPQDCLLCGDIAGAALLCAACAADLPRLSAETCPICAEASPAGATCGACLSRPWHFDATIAAFQYHFPVDRLVQTLKYSHRIATAEFFAQAMLAGPRPEGDIIIPLPLHPKRLAERGFNQSVEIARPLAEALRLPLDLSGCLRCRDTTAQASLPWKERRKNIRHAFECRLDLTDKAVIVIDDVMTSGATLDEFARLLKAHGATRVTNWLAARALRD
ncbi:MAG: ComF family protein [Zoogloeaceae bacterium]|jgi:ComF family protein|nr:ComF family protein [Zoogloeaceae bacterium]